MERESMMEIEVMDEAFNLNSAEAEADIALTPDMDADIAEEELPGCDCECEDETEGKCGFKQKCAQVKDAAIRLGNNLRTCGADTSIRTTACYKVEIFKRGEEKPIDTYTTEKSVAFSLRTVAIVGASALVAGCCIGAIAKAMKK